MGAEHDGEWDAEKTESPQGEGVASDAENDTYEVVAWLAVCESVTVSDGHKSHDRIDCKVSFCRETSKE